MEEFRRVLGHIEIDGIWLDYHHAHASWEQAEPNLPDTCFCPRCLERFQQDTGVELPDRPTPSCPGGCWAEHESQWVKWRCDVFTDWVREFRHDPRRRPGRGPCWGRSIAPGRWRTTRRRAPREAGDRPEGAGAVPRRVQPDALPRPVRPCRRPGLDLAAGRPGWGDTWASRAGPGERLKIWPIVQLSDWGEPVPVEQVAAVLDHGTRSRRRA